MPCTQHTRPKHSKKYIYTWAPHLNKMNKRTRQMRKNTKGLFGTQEFHRNQFNFTRKTHKQEIFHTSFTVCTSIVDNAVIMCFQYHKLLIWSKYLDLNPKYYQYRHNKIWLLTTKLATPHPNLNHGFLVIGSTTQLWQNILSLPLSHLQETHICAKLCQMCWPKQENGSNSTSPVTNGTPSVLNGRSFSFSRYIDFIRHKYI